MIDTPILFLIFNRPDETKQVFEAIRKAAPKKLYIASDGSRDSREDEQSVVITLRKEVMASVDWPCEVHTLFREKNLGCKMAVSGAINWFFENEEKGIILEDDCLPSSSFFSFCEEMLINYADDTRIMSIGGTNYVNTLENDIKYDASYYFSKHVHIWGWATWRRAWIHYDVDLSDLEAFRSTDYINSALCHSLLKKPLLNTFQSVKDGKVDTWDHQWVYTVMKCGALSIIPKANMIKNIGFNINATHTTHTDDIFANLDTFELHDLRQPKFILQNTVLDKIYERYIIKSVLWHKIRRIFKLD